MISWNPLRWLLPPAPKLPDHLFYSVSRRISTDNLNKLQKLRWISLLRPCERAFFSSSAFSLTENIYTRASVNYSITYVLRMPLLLLHLIRIPIIIQPGQAASNYLPGKKNRPSFAYSQLSEMIYADHCSHNIWSSIMVLLYPRDLWPQLIGWPT